MQVKNCLLVGIRVSPSVLFLPDYSVLCSLNLCVLIVKVGRLCHHDFRELVCPSEPFSGVVGHASRACCG